MDIERVKAEIDKFAQEQVRQLESTIGHVKESINQIVQKYVETLEEIPELPKIVDKDIVFVKTIDLEDVKKEECMTYVLELKYYPGSNFMDLVVSIPQRRNYRIDLEEGMKVKVVVYKD